MCPSTMIIPPSGRDPQQHMGGETYMLHDPRQRRPQRRGRHPYRPRGLIHPPSPRLSVTVDTMPVTLEYLERPLPGGGLLLIIRDQIEYGALIRKYQTDLVAWARRRIYASYGSVDPSDDPDAAADMEWWDETWPVSIASVSIAEQAHPGLITPYPHPWLIDPPA